MFYLGLGTVLFFIVLFYQEIISPILKVVYYFFDEKIFNKIFRKRRRKAEYKYRRKMLEREKQIYKDQINYVPKAFDKKDMICNHKKPLPTDIKLSLRKDIYIHKHEYSEQYTPFMTKFIDSLDFQSLYFIDEESNLSDYQILYIDWQSEIMKMILQKKKYYDSSLLTSDCNYKWIKYTKRDIERNLCIYVRRLWYFNKHGRLPSIEEDYYYCEYVFENTPFQLSCHQKMWDDLLQK